MAAPPPAVDATGRLVVSYATTPHSNLSIHVDPSPATALSLLARTPIVSAAVDTIVLGPRLARGVPAPYAVSPVGVDGTGGAPTSTTTTGSSSAEDHAFE